jgi:hypothetical protein
MFDLRALIEVERREFEPYQAEGYSRTEAKLAVAVGINAKTRKAAIRAIAFKLTDTQHPTKAELDRAGRLFDAITELHRPGGGLVGADQGVKLQFLDSKIMLEALQACERSGVPALPVPRQSTRAASARSWKWRSQRCCLDRIQPGSTFTASAKPKSPSANTSALRQQLSDGVQSPEELPKIHFIVRKWSLVRPKIQLRHFAARRFPSSDDREDGSRALEAAAQFQAGAMREAVPGRPLSIFQSLPTALGLAGIPLTFLHKRSFGGCGELPSLLTT